MKFYDVYTKQLRLSLITKPVTNLGVLLGQLFVLANSIIEMEITSIYGKISWINIVSNKDVINILN